MLPIVMLIVIVIGLVGGILLKPRWREYQRATIKAQPFPKDWRLILKKNIPYFYSMPTDIQLQLKQHVMVFIAEKQFFGFEGVVINDEIKVTIAAQACLLLLNRKTDYYSKLKSIYVYPAAFITQHTTHDAAGVLQNKPRVLSGESWELGKVILSWQDSKQGAQVFNDGQNVVIHEFAHQLDQETGSANGAPFLRHKHRKCWSQVLQKNFEQLQQQSQKGEPTLLDCYGATNPAEFFAVASEVFFEKPQQMQSQHPALYRQLRGLYQVNPAVW